MINHPNFSSWWGRHAIEAGHTDFWQIGPMSLWIQHLAHQWKITWQHDGNWLEPQARAVPGSSSLSVPLPANARQITCVFGESRNDLIFAPALADRSVITRLTSPIRILAGDEVRLYVISPLWLRLEVTAPTRVLHELPIFRLSDTWFGPMSAAGELCYASAAPAFLDVREAPLRLHCVLTGVTIRNTGSVALQVEKINVPFPRLSLFYSPRTGFWTDVVTFESRSETGMASMRLERQPPTDASPTQFVTGPRQGNGNGDPNSVIRAFSALFRERNAT